MLRCTIELIPHGDEARARPIGIVEIANVGGGTHEVGNYLITAKKTPPWKGALKEIWRKAQWQMEKMPEEDDEVEWGKVEGFPRMKRGSYDLLYLGLRELVGERNP